MLVKIAPDSTPSELKAIAAAFLEFSVDGVIATNTTSGRKGVEGFPHSGEAGGLSGSPLTSLSLAVVRDLARELKGRVPIVGVGGISSGSEAQAMRESGAVLVQVYTGFIYRGPQLIREIVTAW